MPADAWVPADQLEDFRAAAPELVLEPVPGDPASAPGRDEVRMVVVTSEEVGAIAALPAREVVQVLSAGTEWIEDHVPDGVVLCNARGARDAGVAEWIVAAILAMVRDVPRAV